MRHNKTLPSSYSILGIDPGTARMGCAILRVQLDSVDLAHQESLDLSTTDSSQKLGIILRHIETLIDAYKPQQMAVESPFFGKNPQSMLKLGRVQGIAIGLALAKNLEVEEYAPRSIKQSVTGNGNASKQAVWNVLEKLVQTNKYNINDYDTSDALAVAYCHYRKMQSKHIIPAMSGTAQKRKKQSVRKAWTSYLNGKK